MQLLYRSVRMCMVPHSIRQQFVLCITNLGETDSPYVHTFSISTCEDLIWWKGEYVFQVQ